MELAEDAQYASYYEKISRGSVNAFRKHFANEHEFMPAEGYSQNERFVNLRQYAVAYIEQQSRSQHFDAFIPYLAMTYFDRFVSRTEIPKLLIDDQENVNHFLIGCLTIAWKMRIRSFLVSQFLSERHLSYEIKNVKAMELHIVTALNWRMRSLTAICFAEYFIPRLQLPRDKVFSRRPLRQVIVKSQADIRFTQFPPSTVAASAVLSASTKMFPSRSHGFRASILTNNYVRNSSEDICTCMDALEPLSTDIEVAGEPSGQGAITGASSSGVGDSSLSSLLPTAGPPGDTPEEDQNGKGNAVDEGTATVVERVTEIVLVPIVDQLMDFELEWTDPRAPCIVFSPELIKVTPPASSTLAKKLGNCFPCFF